MKKLIIPVMIIAFVFLSLTALAARPGEGMVWFNGQQLHVLVPPAHVAAGSGRDTLYKINDQASVTRVAPGVPGYHGGLWAVFTTIWTGTPYLITSAAGVDSAIAAGALTATRAPAQDNRCPIQPGRGLAR